MLEKNIEYSIISPSDRLPTKNNNTGRNKDPPNNCTMSMVNMEVETQNSNWSVNVNHANLDNGPMKKQKIAKKECNSKLSRPYQSKKWQQFFLELVEFKKRRGNCLVPHYYTKNPALARWVKRQRYQYNLRRQGKKSSITHDRIRMLEKIGFVWDSHEAAWVERLKELEMFKAVNGTCSVPATYKRNPKLATWVKCQRRQYRLFCEGKPANISSERILDLESIGFEWEVRQSAPSEKMKSWSDHMEKQNQALSTISSDYDLMLDVISLLSDDSSSASNSLN